MDVFENDDERSAPADRFEIATPGGRDRSTRRRYLKVAEGVVGRCRPDGGEDHVGRALGLVEAGEPGAERRPGPRVDGRGRVALEDSRIGTQDRGQGRVGDASPIRQATRPDERGGRRSERLELSGEPTLANPGWAYDRDERGRPVLDRPLENRRQQGQLVLPADHRRVPAEGFAGARRRSADRFPHRDRMVDPLDAHILETAVLHGMPGRAIRPITDDDRAWHGRRLQPGCDVDGVAGHVALVDAAVGREDISGVHRHSKGERCADDIGLAVIQLRHPGLHGQRCPDGPLGIVVVRGGVAEDRDDGIADELLDRPAVALDLLGHGPEERLQDAPQLLGVEAGGELGRRREVREHDRHDPTLLQRLGRCGRRRARWRGLGRRVERRSTRAAEPGRHRGGRPAGRAVSPESRPTGATEPLTRRIRRPTARARAVWRQSLLDPVAHDTPATRPPTTRRFGRPSCAAAASSA